MHEFTKLHEPAGLQCLEARRPELLDVVEIVEHARVALPGLVVLVLEYRGGVARIAGEEQEKVILQIIQALGIQVERARIDAVVAIELKAGDASERGNILILFSDRLAPPVDFDVGRLLGELARMNQLLAMSIERLQQGGGEASRRAETGTGGNI